MCFDSELEMKWAMVFDYLHVEWEYHPKQLERWDFRYTPTFWLPEIGMYAEVEPSEDDLFANEAIPWMVDFDGPCAKGIIILGPLPICDYIYSYVPMFPVLYHTGKSIGCTFGMFCGLVNSENSWYEGFVYDNAIDMGKVYRVQEQSVSFEERDGDAPSLPSNTTIMAEYCYQDPFCQVFSRALKHADWLGIDL